MATFKLPDHWQNVSPLGSARKAPAPGAYICKIISADIISNRLHINLDIDEGEFAGYFQDTFKARVARNPLATYWGLPFSISINFNDPDKGEYFSRLFKRFELDLAVSNNDFNIADTNGNVNTSRLIGKKIGALVIGIERESNGTIFLNFRAEQTYSVKDVHEGKVKEAWIVGVDKTKRKPSEPPPKQNAPATKRDTTPVDDDDIPF